VGVAARIVSASVGWTSTLVTLPAASSGSLGSAAQVAPPSSERSKPKPGATLKPTMTFRVGLLDAQGVEVGLTGERRGLPGHAAVAADDQAEGIGQPGAQVGVAAAVEHAGRGGVGSEAHEVVLRLADEEPAAARGPPHEAVVGGDEQVAVGPGGGIQAVDVVEALDRGRWRDPRLTHPPAGGDRRHRQRAEDAADEPWRPTRSRRGRGRRPLDGRPTPLPGGSSCGHRGYCPVASTTSPVSASTSSTPSTPPAR
jgi:hypothetical protein